MPTHNFSLGWSRNNEVLSQSVPIPIDSENNADLRISGAMSGIGLNDQWGTLNNLTVIDIRCTNGSVQFKTHASGSFLSGGTIQTFNINSGLPFQWYQNSGVPMPFTSGQQVTSVSIERVAPSSGNVLVTLRAGFGGVLLSG